MGATTRPIVSLVSLLVVLCVGHPSTSATVPGEVVDTTADILGGGDIAKAIASGQAPELADAEKSGVTHSPLDNQDDQDSSW